MFDVSKFVLEIIRNDTNLSWFGIMQDKFVSLLIPQLKMLLDNKAFIIITDNEREWFGRYIIANINSKIDQRPILPFFLLNNLYPNVSNMKNDDLIYLNDMLNIVFQNGVNYFYIGKNNYYLLDFAKQFDDSYLWVFDEETDNSVFLSSTDFKLDIKLIQLFNVLDKSIEKTILGEIIVP